MMRYLLLFLVLSNSLCYAQKEDYQWIFNATSVDDVSNVPKPEVRNASILDFNFSPPTFYQNIDATQDIDWTHAALCDEEGHLLLYSNGMTIAGPDHKPIVGGDTISFGPRWNNNTWPNENGEIKTAGFLGTDCAVFIPAPEDVDLVYHMYYNFDETSITGFVKKLIATIDVSDQTAPVVIEKDIPLITNGTIPGHSTCAQHANGRDWWLLQFSNDTSFVFLIDPSGIHLDHTQIMPINMIDLQSTAKFNDDATMFATHQILLSNDSTGARLVLADFDRCTGDLSDIKTDTLSSIDLFATPGTAFSASGQYLYINDAFHCLQYDVWTDKIFETQDTVMVWDGSTFYEPSESIMLASLFGLMRKGPDDKIYIAQSGPGYHLHIIHRPDEKGLSCEAEQNAIRLPTYHRGTLPTHNTLRLGPLDGSPCDTLGLDNNPVSCFRYEQDTIDYLDIAFVDLAYYEPTEWSWDFGDGNTSPLRYPSHVYTHDGAYRVCQTVSNAYSSDTSCDTLYLGVSSIEQTTRKRNITLFPNPVEDLTRVAFHDYLPQSARLLLYNQQGQLISTETLDGVVTLIDMSMLPAGVYVYEIYDMEQRIGTGKVVKVE